jgi:nucleoside-diphosphate-sugar epimerase
MTMPDAIEALLKLAEVDRTKLTRNVYNITSFNPSAREFSDFVKRSFPKAQITFKPDQQRQQIVDSWPGDIDDSAARFEWGFAPQHDLTKAFDEYLVPRIRARYA